MESDRPNNLASRRVGRRASLALLVIAIALFLATRPYIFFLLEPKLSDVGTPYFQYAGAAVDFHRVPYQGIFEIEYPPLAWWAIELPRWIDPRRITDNSTLPEVQEISERYALRFRGLMALCDLACLPLFIFIVRRRRPDFLGPAALLYTISTAILGNVLYDRLDVGLLLLLLLWAACWVQSLGDGPGSVPWTIAAYAALGLSISYKLVPALCAPFLLMADWHATHRPVRLAGGVFSLFVAAALPFAIQYAISGPELFRAFGYHWERGVQVESLWGTLLMLASFFGPATTITSSHISYEAVSELAPTMKIVARILLLVFLGAAFLTTLLSGRRYSRRQAYYVACYVLAAAILLSAVFSPQYLIWTIPLFLMAGVELLPARPLPLLLFAGLVLAICGLTTWIFPYHYFQDPSMANALIPPESEQPRVAAVLPALVLVARNLCYLVLVAWLGVLLWQDLRQPLTSEAQVI